MSSSEKKSSPLPAEMKNENEYICEDVYKKYVSNIDFNTFSDSPQLKQALSEIENKFTPKKKENIFLADTYKRLEYFRRSERVRSCGSYLEWTKYKVNDEKFHLTSANFCRDRLCPLCAWRRSYKLFGQVSQIMDALEKDYAFLFLTLTVPNVTGSELSSKINQMQIAFNRYMRYASIKRAVLGYLRILEITYNKNTDTYHPHFHVILCVAPSYFKHKDYIKRDDWLQMWRRAMKDNSITQVDIRRVKDKFSDSCVDAVQSLKSAVAEIAKYAVKSSDYLFHYDWQLSERCVKVLLAALTGRRLIAFGGVFEEIRQKLNIDCEMSDKEDLLHVDEYGEIRGDVAEQIITFSWGCGAYKLIHFENVCSPLIDFDD